MRQKERNKINSHVVQTIYKFHFAFMMCNQVNLEDNNKDKHIHTTGY